MGFKYHVTAKLNSTKSSAFDSIIIDFMNVLFLQNSGHTILYFFQPEV